MPEETHFTDFYFFVVLNPLVNDKNQENDGK